MYAFIEGEVCEKLNGSLVLLASGVGWQLNCSNNTLQAAPAIGEKMRCHTYLSVREDAMELFGFATREEKEMFLQLTSVSGIGPKTALGVLGAMPLRDLNLAILLGDVNALSRAPGIGKKTAQRIALELKDKILKGGGVESVSAISMTTNPVMDEATTALVMLGFSKANIGKVLPEIAKKNPDAKVEDLIKAALKKL